MEKGKISYEIPLTRGEDELRELNKRYGTDFKTSDWFYLDFLDKLEEKIIETMDRCIENKGSYVDDSLRLDVEIKVTYEPENK